MSFQCRHVFYSKFRKQRDGGYGEMDLKFAEAEKSKLVPCSLQY
jgi:hypothetical protein